MNVCPQDSKVTPCTGEGSSDKWCCGGSDSCCKSNIGVITLEQVLGVSVLSSSLGAASQTSSTQTIETINTVAVVPTTSLTAATSSAERTQNSDEKRLLGVVVAGIVIGVMAGIAWLAAGLWLLRRRFRKKSAQANNEHECDISYNSEVYFVPPIQEMESEEKTQELNGHALPHELASELPELDSSWDPTRCVSGRTVGR